MNGIDISQLLPTIGYMVVIFAVFYFLLIMPQKKKDKQHKEMVDAIKKGDTIITIGGIHGKVAAVKDGVITVETLGGSKFKLENWGIRSVEKAALSKADVVEALEEEASEEE